MKAYLYTCETHGRKVGEHVRDVDRNERFALERLETTVKHATNCWVKGCQDGLTQVRLVEAS